MLSSLSEQSFLRVLDLLEERNQSKLILNIRGCNYKLNRVIVQNQYHLPFAEGTSFYYARLVRLPRTEPQEGDRRIGGYVKIDDSTGQSSANERVFSDPPGFYVNNLDENLEEEMDQRIEAYRAERRRKGFIDLDWRKKIPLNVEVPWDYIFEKQQKLLEKVRDVEQFGIFGFKLDSNFVERFKDFSKKTSKTTILNIQNCDFNWSEDDFTKFLELFPRLESLCLHGKFNNPFLTNKHLESLSGHIEIAHIPAVTRSGSLTSYTRNLTLPGFTDELLHLWEERLPEGIRIEGILTRFSFDRIWRLVRSIAEQSLLSEDEEVRQLNLGVFEWTEQLERSIWKAQRNKDYTWKIDKFTEHLHVYTVITEDYGLMTSFVIHKHSERPKYGELLDKLLSLREKLANANDLVEAGHRLALLEEDEERFFLDEIRFTKKMMSDIARIEIKMLDYDEDRGVCNYIVEGRALWNVFYERRFTGKQLEQSMNSGDGVYWSFLSNIVSIYRWGTQEEEREDEPIEYINFEIGFNPFELDDMTEERQREVINNEIDRVEVAMRQVMKEVQI